METTETMRMPALGQDGEPCSGCGAPLAADQRYCLNCGQRRTGPRVDHQRYLARVSEHASPPAPETPHSTAIPPSPPTSEPSRSERDFAPLAAVGGIAILGLMLLVGVLIGRGTESSSPSPPQVITVGGSAGGETASAGTGDAAIAPPGSKETADKPAGKNGTGAKALAGGLTGEAARQSESTVQASKDDLEALNQQSGEDYEDTVKKLPDKIATPGAPPPVDKSKAPGGGGGAVTIE